MVNKEEGRQSTKGCPTYALAIIVIGALLLIFAIINVGIESANLHITKNRDSTSLSSSDLSSSEQIRDLLLTKRSLQECKSGLTTDPYLICLDKCNSEFCAENYDNDQCRGDKCGDLDIDLEQCKIGCDCCQSLGACLVLHDADREFCERELPHCKFGPVPFSIHKVTEICYLAESTQACVFPGIGFNDPVPCSIS